MDFETYYKLKAHLDYLGYKFDPMDFETEVIDEDIIKIGNV